MPRIKAKLSNVFRKRFCFFHNLCLNRKSNLQFNVIRNHFQSDISFFESESQQIHSIVAMLKLFTIVGGHLSLADYSDDEFNDENDGIFHKVLENLITDLKDPATAIKNNQDFVEFHLE